MALRTDSGGYAYDQNQPSSDLPTRIGKMKKIYGDNSKKTGLVIIMDNRIRRNVCSIGHKNAI